MANYCKNMRKNTHFKDKYRLKQTNTKNAITTELSSTIAKCVETFLMFVPW